MKTDKMIGIIDSTSSDKIYRLINVSKQKGYAIRKVMPAHPRFTDYLQNLYPEAEMVSSVEAFHDDGSIDLVLISTSIDDHLDLAGNLIRAGKQVRLI